MKKILLLITLIAVGNSVFASHSYNKNKKKNNNNRKSNKNNQPNIISSNNTSDKNSFSESSSTVFVFGSSNTVNTDQNTANNVTQITNNNTNNTQFEDFIENLQNLGSKINPNNKIHTIDNKLYTRHEWPWGVSITKENLTAINNEKDFLQDVASLLKKIEDYHQMNNKDSEIKIEKSCKKRGELWTTVNGQNYTQGCCFWIKNHESETISVHSGIVSNEIYFYGSYCFNGNSLGKHNVESHHFKGKYNLNNPYLCYVVFKKFIDGEKSSEIEEKLNNNNNK